MLANNLISELRSLDHADKLRVMQFLLFELAKDEGAVLKPDTSASVVPAIAETALLSEATLAEDWLKPEEDEAWAYLQRATS